MTPPRARPRAGTWYLLAHGSEDPRHAHDVGGIADRLAAETGRRVLPCYLDHCGPDLAGTADSPGVVLPLLFSPGYHARFDVAAAVAAAAVPLTVARPPVLTGAAAWARQLLAEGPASLPVGAPNGEVIWVTAGSRDLSVLRAWDETAGSLGVPIVHASGPGPRLLSAAAGATASVVPLLVARGYFSDVIARQAAAAGLPVAPHAGSSAALIAELARLAAEASPAAA